MLQSRSFKFSRASMVLISIALLLVTLLTTAMVSGSRVNEVLSSSCAVPLRVSTSGSNFDEVAAEIDARLANELAAAKCAANELLSGAVLLGVAQDIRLAQELATAKGAAEELAFEAASGIEQDSRLALGLAAAEMAVAEIAQRQLSADQIARKIAAQEAREALMLGEILSLQGIISQR